MMTDRESLKDVVNTWVVTFWGATPTATRGGGTMKPLLILALLLCTLAPVSAGDRWRGDDYNRWAPYGSERFEGSRTWKPREWRWDGPDHVIIDKPGKCEVRCERVGREYRCKEYRC
jgi:hypothetical protein